MIGARRQREPLLGKRRRGCPSLPILALVLGLSTRVRDGNAFTVIQTSRQSYNSHHGQDWASSSSLSYDGISGSRLSMRLSSSSDFSSLEASTISAIVRAEDAMKSASMAREIRRHRSGRGRVSDSQLVVKIEHHEEVGNQTLAHKVIAIDSRGSTKVRSRHLENFKTKVRAQARREKKRVNELEPELSWESTIEVLRTYHSIHGDLVFPRRYTVPSGEDSVYPTEWHGRDLDSTVYNMNWWQKNVKNRPERVAELGSLGFVWERLQPEWNLVLEALITYSSIYGNLLVPNKFVVPHGNEKQDWPRATWGLALGSCVYRIRSRNDFLRDSGTSGSRRDQLDRLGFVWDVHENSFQKFRAALQNFARLQGTGPYTANAQGQMKAIRVPSKFVVPEGDETWPKGLWGYPLGEKCTAVRKKELYVKGKARRKEQLEDIGFRWTGNGELGWLKVVHAAAIYSRLNSRVLDVPSNFVVPKPTEEEELDWPWPEHLWGFRLGQRLKDVRVKGAYLKGRAGEARRRQLDALGFVWQPKRGRRRQKDNSPE